MGSNKYELKRTCAYCERDATHKTKGYVMTTYLCKPHASMAEGDGFVVEKIKEEIKEDR